MVDFESDPRFGHLVEEASASPWLDLPPSEALQPYIRCEMVDGAMVLVDHSPGGVMSRVFCLGLEKPATAKTVERIFEVYHEEGIEAFLIHLSPMARPTTLPRILEEHGLKLGGREAVAVREATRVRRPDPFFKIQRVESSDREAIVSILEGIGGLPPSFIELISKSAGQPRWNQFIALDGTKPYALSGIYIRGDSAWMAPGWTLPDYRNRGAHAALISQCINTAADAGCSWITTSYPARTEDRTRSFERAGFNLLYLRSLFRPDAAPLMPVGVTAAEPQRVK
jgi:hypothetical protein